MNLPRLTPVQSLPFNLPAIKDNQAWALNQDTSPPSLVLVEFIYNEITPSIQSASQESVNLLNTTINQTLSSINTELTNLSSRITTIESIINTNNFMTTSTGQLVVSANS